MNFCMKNRTTHNPEAVALNSSVKHCNIIEYKCLSFLSNGKIYALVPKQLGY